MRARLVWVIVQLWRSSVLAGAVDALQNLAASFEKAGTAASRRHGSWGSTARLVVVLSLLALVGVTTAIVLVGDDTKDSEAIVPLVAGAGVGLAMSMLTGVITYWREARLSRVREASAKELRLRLTDHLGEVLPSPDLLEHRLSTLIEANRHTEDLLRRSIAERRDSASPSEHMGIEAELELHLAEIATENQLTEDLLRRWMESRGPSASPRERLMMSDELTGHLSDMLSRVRSTTDLVQRYAALRALESAAESSSDDRLSERAR